MNPQGPRDGSTSRRKSWRPAAAEDVSIYAVRRYALHAEIGAGRAATVHLGRLLGPEKFARTVAVKRLRPQYAKDAECVAMLLEGARLAAAVRHSNVVPALDIVTGDELLVVTEYVHGESLATLLRTLRGRDAQAPLAIVSGIVTGMLRGLQAVHDVRGARRAAADRTDLARHDLAHDLTPQDVLVGVDGVARWIDLGFGRPDTERPEAERVAGAADAPAGGRSDVFCVSVILWEALAGRPFLPRIAPEGFEPPSRYRAGLEPALDAIVAKGLASEPAARFANPEAMATALEEALPPATPAQIGAWVESLARTALDERARLLGAVEHSAPARASSSVRPPADTLPAEGPGVTLPAEGTVLTLPTEGTVVTLPAEAPVATRPKVELVTRRERASAPSFGTRRGLGPRDDASDPDGDDASADASVLGGPFLRKRGAILAAGIASAALVVLVCARLAGGDRAARVETSAPATPVETSASPTTSVAATTTPAAPPEPVAEPAPVAIARAEEPARSAPAQSPRAQVAPAAPATVVTPAPPASKAAKPRRAARPTRDDVL
jgi:hypothetical protein